MEYKNEKKICQNCKQDFIIESEDFNFYEKIKVPPPTFCFDCRLKRKLSYFNLRTLFKHKCNKCKKNIISMHSPESTRIVYCTDCYNDREDCTEYVIDYDFFKTFFEQFYNLYQKIPMVHLKHKNSKDRCENSNYTYHSKNVYLSYTTSKSEDIFYSKQVLRGNKVCIDCEIIHENERGYELFGTSRSYNSKFLVRSRQCVDSAFLFNCNNCTNCCMSSNLVNKSYVFGNKQLTREKYLQVMKDFPFDSYSIQEKLKKEFINLAKNSICRYANMTNATNCTGDFIGNSKNAHYSFELIDTEDSKYIVFGANTIRDSYDLFHVGLNQSCYELMSAGGTNNNVMFSIDIDGCFDTSYSVSCKNSSNLFACIGLENKSFCILNKQYTKEEYEKLVPKIIEHMNTMPYVNKKRIVYKYGEFFPTEFSPFAYNESSAFEEFPMTEKEVLENGYLWREGEEKIYSATITSDKLSDNINDVTDDILKEIIACPNKGQIETKCTFAYRIVPDELRFYRLMKIPLPRYCPNCRYYQRRKFINPLKLWHRTCTCDKKNHIHKGHCTTEFETSYAPGRPEIVYCEKCYQQEVY